MLAISYSLEIFEKFVFFGIIKLQNEDFTALVIINRLLSIITEVPAIIFQWKYVLTFSQALSIR